MAKVLCSCGCARLVSKATEWRHAKNKAAHASVPEATRAAVRNATPGPAFSPNASPARRRAGSLTNSPRRKRQRKNPVIITDAASVRVSDVSDGEPAPAEGSLAADVDPIDPVDAALPRELDGGLVGAGSGAEESPDGNEHPENVDYGTSDYVRGRYRVTVEDVEDEDEHSSMSDGSESDFASEAESEGIFGDDSHESPAGPTAWELLGEELEREVAELDVTEGLSENDLDILRAFAFKTENYISRKTYRNMPRYFRKLLLPSTGSSRTRLKFLSGVKPVMYDCCPQSCVLFVGRHAELESCPVCKSARYDSRRRPLQQFAYLPLIPRLAALYRNRATSRRQLYRDEATQTQKDGVYRDYVDGAHYRALCQKPVRIDGETCAYLHFSSATDVALAVMTDGFAPFRKRKQTCWPLLIVNYNLDPEIRYRLENLISLGVVPGPKQPADLNSFLWPLVQELLVLARGVTAYDGNKACLFTLRAYLLLGIGDMPAVAKLMCMKGHNGRHPCRFCKIRGLRVPNARGNAHYVPLDRTRHPDAGDIPNYDPAALPMRTHQEMLRQALDVESAPNPTQAQLRGHDSGMNGMPLLAILSSIRLHLSFPVEFMHLVWLNLIPNLTRLYTGDFKGLDTGDGDYELAEAVWEDVGRITGAAGSTIPSAFGARVPDLAKDRSHMIAETWCIWTMFIAPVVLRGRFVDEKYYRHFLDLVRLLNICLKLEIKRADIDKIRTGFIAWVRKYEEYFYQGDPARLATCASTVHALLHIADSIEANGPVGGYWSFVMERYCSALRPAIRSRRYPYTSIANHIVDAAYIQQLRLQYNLDTYFEPLGDAGSAEPLVKADEFHVPSYPSSALMKPSTMHELSPALRRKIARHLSVRFGNANAKNLEQLVPHNIEAWGKVRRLDGGDTMHAYEVVTQRHDERDRSFVRYALEVDKFAHLPRRKPVYELRTFFGQLLYIFVLPLPPLPKYKLPHSTTLLLAYVAECDNLTLHKRSKVHYYSGELKAAEIIDLAAIECVVGRVEDRGRWAIIDRSNSLTRVIVPEGDDDDE